jgi:hypothetical protein
MKTLYLTASNRPGVISELEKLDPSREWRIRIDNKARSNDQNAISHSWYEQLAQEGQEYNALGYKNFCKLHFGVPILRAEDEDFRHFYDGAIKSGFTYEQKLEAMNYMPVTSLMNTKQMSQYLEAVQGHFAKQGIMLEFPLDA